MLGTSINWGRSGWRAALPKGSWGCRLAAGSVWVGSRPGSQEGNGVLGCVQHSTASRSKEGISRCVQRWCGLTSSTVWRSGPCNFRRISRAFNVSRGGQQRWWLGWKACPVRSEDTGFVQFGEKEVEGQPHCSLQVPEEGKWRRRCWSLLPGIQCQDMWLKAASVRGRFRLGIRNHFFTEGVVKPWNRLPREVVDALSLSVFGAFLITYFIFWSALKWSGSWTRWLL